MPDPKANARLAAQPASLQRGETAPARSERAIGINCRPETERFGHVFLADLPAQFDAVIHRDRTTALTLLGPPETFPFGV